MEKVVEDKTLSIEEAFKKFEKLHDAIKYKAFGKVTINNDRRDLQKEEERKHKTEEEEAKLLF